MARQKARWGEAKTAIAVVITPYLDQIRRGASVAKIYQELAAQGKTDGFSKDALYHFLRNQRGKSPHGKAKKGSQPASKAVTPTAPRPPQATILPASAVVSGDLPPSLFGEVNLEDWAEQMLGGDAEAEGGE
ncbi:hypothetical protein [Novispirillum itersonii]|uniref:Uncharacterized protein n=1 Tax=Novispirillum itersonii TaxID=189 RepID=A0A7W9ZI00_NOVIT|nr:hypothetical protein [Novispirillum itersonii]MBB6211810.1 hypothetical protein [Novispirillum itersonii]